MRACKFCGVELSKPKRGPSPTMCKPCRSKHCRGEASPCSVEGCTNVRSRKDGLCQTHSKRLEKTGGLDKIDRRRYREGAKFGLLVIVEHIEGSPKVLCECECGRRVQVALTNLIAGAATTCGLRAVHPKDIEEPCYSTLHKRVSKLRGSASKHCCSFCQEQAKDWAYGGAGGVSERREKTGREKGMLYSLSPADYIPVCRKHHRWLDSNPLPSYAETGTIDAGRAILCMMVNDSDGERKPMAAEPEKKERSDAPDRLFDERVRDDCRGRGICIVCSEELSYDASPNAFTCRELECKQAVRRAVNRKNMRNYRERKKGA